MKTAPSRTMHWLQEPQTWADWSLLTKREDHSWHPARCHRHPIVQRADLVEKNSSRFPVSDPGSDTRRKAERRSTSFLRDCMCCLPFAWGFEAGWLKILSLFLWMTSSVGFVLSTRRCLTKLSNGTWPTWCARKTPSAAPGGAAISFVSSTSRSWLSSSNKFPKSSIILITDCTFLRKAVCTQLTCHDALCLVIGSPAQLHHGTLRWAWRPLVLPPSTVVEVVSQGYRTPISFNGCVVLLVGLIDGDGGERPVRLLDHEIPSSEFLNYSGCHQQFHHVSQMHRNPAPVVDVIQGMEQGHPRTWQTTLGAESSRRPTPGPSTLVAVQWPSIGNAFCWHQ